MEYYLALNNTTGLINTTTWMILENIMLSKRGQT